MQLSSQGLTTLSTNTPHPHQCTLVLRRCDLSPEWVGALSPGTLRK